MKAYLKPITFTMPMAFQADTEMIESVCENNAKSLERISLTKAAQPVVVPPATLSRYVGTYDTERLTIFVNGFEDAWTAPAVVDLLPVDAEFTTGGVANYLDFSGALDELAIYGDALTAERVDAHYRAGR